MPKALNAVDVGLENVYDHTMDGNRISMPR